MITLLRWLLRLLYGFKAWNTGVLAQPGPVLLLPNHVSWWDWLMVGVCLEPDWRFVTSSTTAQTSFLHRWLMTGRRTFPVDISSPYAVKHMAQFLQGGGRLVLFPEGRISTTGSLMKLYGGTGFLIQKTGAKVVIGHLRGARRLPFSRNPEPKQWFPRLSAHFRALGAPPPTGSATGDAARNQITEWLRDEMVRLEFDVEMEHGAATLAEAIRETALRHPGRVAAQDTTMTRLSYRRLFLGASLLSRAFRRLPPSAERRVGVLLPNLNAVPATLLGLWLAERVPAVLNFSGGVGPMLACARLAGLKQIITARAFVEKIHLDLEPFRQAGVQIIFLEEVRAGIGRWRKISAMVGCLFRLPCPPKTATDATAVVLFTSGSEGEPKGVELTHRNLLANLRQMLAVIDVTATDRILNALPLFHCFGLNVGLFLPLVRGCFVFLFISPLRYRAVAALAYDMEATILFGTNTFLTGYARKANPYDFHSLRYVFAGAEKLQESTVALWMTRFGVRLLEGYGATECSPCVSADVPTRPRPGTAGRFLPGVEHRLEPVEGFDQAAAPGTVGRLFVRGPNIMRGYLNPAANAQFQSLGGWYDTGDIVRVDLDGSVQVLGRLKRFAKIGGEMVSLTAVEDALAGAFPQYGPRCAVVVVARPDEKRGEKLLAVTNEPRLTLPALAAAISAKGLTNLAIPKDLRLVGSIPLLGTGKTDYRGLEKQL